MPFIAVVCIVLLLFAAIGATLWWRPTPPSPWYGGAVFCWGVFFLALYITWPTLKALGL
jgi:hypothetical protein